jgi:hypothetical protein
MHYVFILRNGVASLSLSVTSVIECQHSLDQTKTDFIHEAFISE